MVESIYFLKPAWCGTHLAGLWPEQDFQSVTKATAFRRWLSLAPTEVLHLGNNLDLSAMDAVYGNEKRGQPPYNPPMMTKVLVYAYCV